MREFDLEAARNGAQLRMRCGLKVTDVDISDACIYGYAQNPTGERVKYLWRLDGKTAYTGRDNSFDLMIEEPSKFVEDLLRTTNVDHPSHYNNGSIECIDAMRAAFGDEQVEVFCRLSAFKYLWRAERKEDKQQDLDKARWYIDYGLKLLNKNTRREG